MVINYHTYTQIYIYTLIRTKRNPIKTFSKHSEAVLGDHSLTARSLKRANTWSRSHGPTSPRSGVDDWDEIRNAAKSGENDEDMMGT